jgi:glycosyltransferase involved in cell wall biosynthesis
MKTLQIIGSKQMGGAERWFLRFARALKARRQEVLAVVRRGSELDGELLSGLPHRALPLRTVWDPLSRYEVTRLIRKEQPALVQTYMGRATRLTHIPQNTGIVHLSRLGGYYKPDGYRHAHAWVGNTKGICDYLIRNGFPSGRVFHIYNFAEPVHAPNEDELRALREKLSLQPDELLLLTPGRFVPFKGHRFLLAALARLPATVAGKRLRLAMLGDGPLREDLQQQAVAAGINDRIIWAGWQLNTDPWYALADIVVFPSREEEPLGNVVMEAWCVPCDDPAALAEGLQVMIADQALRQQLVAGGSATLARNFSETSIMAQYEDLYRQLITAAGH